VNRARRTRGKHRVPKDRVPKDQVRQDPVWKHPVRAIALLLFATTAGSLEAQPASPPAGVQNTQRAWQNWTLNCQGCHRPDGTGSAATTPSVAGTVSRFLSVDRGREYLVRVPGVATSPLTDADLAELLNWMLWRFDPEHLPVDFPAFSAAEVGGLRKQPLRLEASKMRSELLAKAAADVR
jgi:mono/diheme cytochrome c family protein